MLEISILITFLLTIMVIPAGLGDITGKKFAIYLRRSEGEKGTTKKQYERIKKEIAELERATGREIDVRIVGKDINKKKRFNAKTDLIKEGDIFNEGEGASGFKIESRPVFKELIKRVRAGDYDGIAMEGFDRVSRDIHGLSHFALPLWREDGKILLGLTDGNYLNDDRANEFLLGVTSNAASLTKAQEIEKSKKGRANAIDLGFIKAGRPEFLGSGTKSAGLDYREAWRLMQLQGESKRGSLNNPGEVAKAMGKVTKSGKGENKWASEWYLKMSEYNRLGVLESWLSGIEAFNQYILDLEGYPSVKWNNDKGVARIKKATAGFFAYPAGIKVEQSNEYVQFPNAGVLDLNLLAELEDPRDYPERGFIVRRVQTIPTRLSVVQMQGRSRATR